MVDEYFAAICALMAARAAAGHVGAIFLTLPRAEIEALSYDMDGSRITRSAEEHANQRAWENLDGRVAVMFQTGQGMVHLIEGRADAVG